MKIKSSESTWSRRRFLRGTGLALAIPQFLSLPALANRKSSPNDEIVRSVFIYIPNGVNTLTWQIQSAGFDYVLPDTLAALERHRGRLTPISGLHHPAGIGKAHDCDKIWLTSAPIDTADERWKNSVSCDQLMAGWIGSRTRFPSLQLSITGGSLSWNDNGSALPSENRPSAVFRRLFEADSENELESRQRLERRRSILDRVLEDANRTRQQLSQSDRVSLDEYLDAVREVEQRTIRAEAWLSKPKPQVDDESRLALTREMELAEAGDYYRTMYDLMALALQTDSTRIITCMSGSESNSLALPEIGVPQTRHELSHHNDDPVQMERLSRSDSFLVEQFAYFLDRLQQTDGSGQAIIENTMVLFGSGMAYGHAHGNANLPTMIAGGESLGFQHGRHLDFNQPKIGSYPTNDREAFYRICSQPVDSNARLSNLLLTMSQCVAPSLETFGDSLGPIDQLFD